MGFSVYDRAYFDPRHSVYFNRYICLVILCVTVDAFVLIWSILCLLGDAWTDHDYDIWTDTEDLLSEFGSSFDNALTLQPLEELHKTTRVIIGMEITFA